MVPQAPPFLYGDLIGSLDFNFLVEAFWMDLLNSRLWAQVLFLLKSRLGVLMFSFFASHKGGRISEKNTTPPPSA